MNKARRSVWLAAVIGTFALSLAALADPIFEINTYQDWQLELSPAGHIQPVSALDFYTMTRDPGWPPEYSSLPLENFYTPQLYVVESFNEEPCLVMSWQGREGQRTAAAWDYVYGSDPALGGNKIEFSIFPPVPSTLFSLNLIDRFGNYREWIWHADVPGNQAGEVPAGQWSTLVIDPVTGASNWPTFGGSPFIVNQPGQSFDLNSIQILRFNENIAWTPGFPPGPGGNVPPDWAWNAWDHVKVQPEPATMVLLGGGIAALLARRRRKQ